MGIFKQQRGPSCSVGQASARVPRPSASSMGQAWNALGGAIVPEVEGEEVVVGGEGGGEGGGGGVSREESPRDV
jgi:hypothetical protein